MEDIGDSLSDHGTSDDGVDGADQDDAEMPQGKLSEDTEPGWVMGTMTQTVQQRLERFRPRLMKLNE